MDNSKLENASDFCNKMMEEYMKDLKWHQRLILRTEFKLDDIWTWFLINVIYRKYKRK